MNSYTMVDPEKKVQVLASEGWNPMFLGIVAGRLLEELKTVIVLNIEDVVSRVVLVVALSIFLKPLGSPRGSSSSHFAAMLVQQE